MTYEPSEDQINDWNIHNDHAGDADDARADAIAESKPPTATATVPITIYSIASDNDGGTDADIYADKNEYYDSQLEIIRNDCEEGENAKLDELITAAKNDGAWDYEAFDEAWEYWYDHVRDPMDTYSPDERTVHVPLAVVLAALAQVRDDLTILSDATLGQRASYHKAELKRLGDEAAKVWRLRIRTNNATDEDKERAARIVAAVPLPVPYDDAKIDSIVAGIKALRPSWNVWNENFNGMMFVETKTEAQGKRCICFGSANATFGASVYETAENGNDVGYIDTGVSNEAPDIALLARRAVEGVEKYLTADPTNDSVLVAFKDDAFYVELSH